MNTHECIAAMKAAVSLLKSLERGDDEWREVFGVCAQLQAAIAAAPPAPAAQADAHELWAAAQLVPGEGIEDGVERINALLAKSAHAAQAVAWDAVYGAVAAAITACKNASGQHRAIDDMVNAVQITHDALGTDTTPPAQPEPVAPVLLTDAESDVSDERRRQVDVEGWTPEHDDEHNDGSLAWAAVCYAMPDHYRFGGDLHRESTAGPIPPMPWPASWRVGWWKPKDRRSDLVRAAALLLAEIERFDRAVLTANGRKP